MAKNHGNQDAGITPEALEAAIVGMEVPTQVAISAEEFAAMQAQVAMLIKQHAEKDKLIADLSAAPGVPSSISHASTKERWAIVIDEGHEQHDEVGVFVSVNGRSYQVLRGQVAEVPPEVLEVLNHAVIDKHIPQKDASGMPNGTITRPSRRFPYRKLGKAVDREGVRIQTFTVTDY